MSIMGYTANALRFSDTDALTNGTAAQDAQATPNKIPTKRTILFENGVIIMAATRRGNVQYPKREHA